ncbi:extracellular solute-binding protein [Roseococcus suduntuyensis]|uniref:Microcin C transport system substrate-binding protein n=1 Tax=Roseococcus suduntuyensis TaxID=455361 RepID=A0A840AFV6_9PROT|nr:extracellular solute-binding protein [Roseococcus suduntuyensis]MBB3899416.1 microcin C transport system substrate-binding protein [Roseococcus suduntuyensis]
MKRRDLFAAGFGLVAFSGRAMAQQGPIRTHALSLLGEPALPADFPHWPWVNPDAPKGGQVTLTALGSFDSLNPFILRGTPAVGLINLYDQLLATSSDEASTEYAHLAETIEIPADRMGVSFELREGARWHDGRPITAEDVVFSFQTLRAQGRPFFRSYWGDVAEAVAESPRRVTFRFRSNENRELALILGQIYVLPKHFWEGRDFARPLQEAPLGSGSYRVESFDSGRSITYARVPDAWSANLNTKRGTENFDVMRYEYFRDATVAFEAFKAGQIDFRTENIARNWATGYDFPAMRRGLVIRDEIRHELPTGMQAFVMNLRRPLFQDARVREALMTVFDYEWLNANIFNGLYARTTSFFSNSELASSGLPEGRELEILERYRGRVPESVFTTEYRLPVTDGSGNNRDGLRRALTLMREAGWEVRNRRMVNPQGQGFSFEILLNGASFERVALPYVQWLQRLGIEARVRTVDPAQYQVRTDAFDFDMTVDVMGQSLSPGNEQRDYWTCEKARENGSQNVAGICDPVVDELVELLINAPDREELIHRTRALDRVLLHHHFVIPQWHNRRFWVAFWDRFGRPERNPRYGLGFDSWWIDPARDAALTAARRG